MLVEAIEEGLAGGSLLWGRLVHLGEASVREEVEERKVCARKEQKGEGKNSAKKSGSDGREARNWHQSAERSKPRNGNKR